MSATRAEQWISPKEICREEIGNDRQISDPVVEEGPVKNNNIFSITDRCMVLRKSHARRRVSDVFIRCQGGITATYGAYDDVYVARSEQEKNDLIESLRKKIKKMDTKKTPYTFDSIGEGSHD